MSNFGWPEFLLVGAFIGVATLIVTLLWSVLRALRNVSGLLEKNIEENRYHNRRILDSVSELSRELRRTHVLLDESLTYLSPIGDFLQGPVNEALVQYGQDAKLSDIHSLLVEIGNLLRESRPRKDGS